MSEFFASLIERASDAPPALERRRPSIFEPVALTAVELKTALAESATRHLPEEPGLDMAPTRDGGVPAPQPTKLSPPAPLLRAPAHQPRVLAEAKPRAEAAASSSKTEEPKPTIEPRVRTAEQAISRFETLEDHSPRVDDSVRPRLLLPSGRGEPAATPPTRSDDELARRPVVVGALISPLQRPADKRVEMHPTQDLRPVGPASAAAKTRHTTKTPPDHPLAAPLRRREPVAPPRPSHPAPVPAASQPAAAAAAPLPIQVTIGRIEVSASAPPASPGRSRKAGGPRLSLDEYLRSRNGGRR